MESMKSSLKRIIYTFIVTLIVVFSSTFAILMTLERNDYRNYLMGDYNKNMYQLISSVENIESNLSKVPILGSREQVVVAFEEIFRYSSMANDKLHSLPIDQQKLNGTSKFLTQVGDFCYALGNNFNSGNELADRDVERLEILKNEASKLETNLKDVQNNINSGEIKWGEIRQKATGVLSNSYDNTIASKFENIQKQVIQYPALVYDGPFSDNTLEIKPKINESPSISLSKAEEVLKNAIGKDKIQEIVRNKDVNSQKIPCYSFKVNIKNRKEYVDCEVTKKGGMVYYILDNRNVKEKKIDINRAQKIGEDYLTKIGYKNMKPTYYLIYNNSATINYIYNVQDVSVYSEQVKVNIALDNGDVIGVEAGKYLTAHDENRKIEKPLISQDKARESLSKRLNISSVKLAIVPTEFNTEVLCYEFNGSYNENKFIVYINAKTGTEVKILQIRDTPNGKLTI